MAGGKDPVELDEALALPVGGRPRVRVHGVRVLGLDLGSKRIGVAVTDPAGRVATPDRVLGARGQGPRPSASPGLMEEWEAELVVVGLPLSLSGADGPAARAAREKRPSWRVLPVPVESYDERLDHGDRRGPSTEQR